jgi:epoxyqueuosine reductase
LNPIKKHHATLKIKEKAKALGFDSVGISDAVFLEKEAPLLEKWLNKAMHAGMDYMERNFDKRLDPKLLVPNAKSVVSVLLNYYPSEFQRTDTYKISKYAYGRDYHKVIKGKLKQLLAYIQEEYGQVQGRGFVDSAPVMDRAWAEKSGLGWIGKNANLIQKKAGSFFFIGELILDLELEADAPTTDHCGSCTACIDACPTDAIEGPNQINSHKCISYLTIELKENIIPTGFEAQMQDWMFGCDICQDVCPWNRFAKPNKTTDFQPKETIINYSKSDWEEITEEIFNKTLEGSPIRRAKFEGIKRNIKYLKRFNV